MGMNNMPLVYIFTKNKMNRTRFREILHSSSERIDTDNKTNLVFAIKPVKPKTINLEEISKDEVDILFLSEEDHEEEEADIGYSDIYVGDCQENNIHAINPLLSSSSE